MRITNLTLATLLLLNLFVVAAAQNLDQAKATKSLADVEREVKDFYDSYAEDLRQHRQEAIANRYDTRGVYFLGNGHKSLETFESTRTRYLTKWTGPKSFEWKDLSIEVLSSDAAVVVGRFEWQTATGETFKYSYTGVVIRQPGGWRIRVEDESTQPPKGN